MQPSETAAGYDKIARWWQENVPSEYGLAALKRAVMFAPKGGIALDVGCGSEGRFMALLREKEFETEGLDISVEMIALAKERDPASRFYTADIATWEFPREYDFISAWDSTFHLPLDLQEPVLRKLCDGLAAGGVLLFTCGGSEAGEITGTFQNQNFGYSSLGVETFVRILDESGCLCRHVEYDQHPEKHVVVIAEKKSSARADRLLGAIHHNFAAGQALWIEARLVDGLVAPPVLLGDQATMDPKHRESENLREQVGQMRFARATRSA